MMSSEEALNKIFVILDTMVLEDQERREKEKDKDNKKEDDKKTDKTVIDLLKGIVDTAKEEAGAGAGKQLEELAKGLDAMKDIDHEKIDNIATSIEHINKVFKNLDGFSEDSVKNVDNLIKLTDKFAEINEEASLKLVNFINNLHLDNLAADIKNLEGIGTIIVALDILSNTNMKSLSKNLDALDERKAKKLGKFISQLISSLDKALKGLTTDEITKMLKPIGELMYGLSALVNMNVFKMKISLNPFKGKLLGRQIG